MRAVVMHEPGNVTVEELPKPTILEPTDAIIKLAATCICGSDLWPYRGMEPVHERRMGHEYVGTVVEVGEAVTTVRPGDFVVGSFCISCGECSVCRAGYPSRCATAAAQGDAFVGMRAGGTQAEYARIALADGTLVKTPGTPTREQIPSLLAASDVLGTGWFAADEAGAGPGTTIVVVGDGAVGLGAIIGVGIIIIEEVLKLSSKGRFALPPLAVGMGMYLPASLTIMIPVGGVIGFFYDRWSAKRKDPERARRMGTLLATGLIVGESLFGVIYAGIVGATGSEEPLAVLGDSFATPATIIGALFFFGSIFALYRWTSGMVSRTDSAPATDEAAAEEALDVH